MDNRAALCGGLSTVPNFVKKLGTVLNFSPVGLTFSDPIIIVAVSVGKEFVCLFVC